MEKAAEKPDPICPKPHMGKMLSISREARSNQRRLLTAFGTVTDSDLLKFNGLKFRKKQLKVIYTVFVFTCSLRILMRQVDKIK